MPDPEKTPLENRRCRRFRTLLLLTVAVMIWAAPAMAKNDLLLLPAVKSPRASSSILLDVTRAGERLVAVGERGHVLLSDNNGETWRQASVPVSVTLTAVQFPSDTKGWIVGHDGIVLHSNDGGENWMVQFDGDRVNRLIIGDAEQQLASKEAELAQGGEDLSSELEDLRYALESAQLAVEGGGSTPFLDLYFLNESTGFIVGAYGLIFHTEDGGSSWQPWNAHISNPSGFHYNAICAAGELMFVAGEAGTLYRSTDAGQNWQVLESPYEGSFFDIVCDQRGEQVIAMGLRGNAFRSGDEGASWQRIETGVETPLSGGVILADGRLAIASRSLLVGDAATLHIKRTRVKAAAYSAVAESAGGQLILVGLDGLKKVESPGHEGEGK